jgi:integrase
MKTRGRPKLSKTSVRPKLTDTTVTVKLTERAANDACPIKVGADSYQRIYLDKQRKGFGLSVSANGTKSFIVMRRVAGKPVRFVFGKLGELSVVQARAHAEQLLARMAMGENPQEQRRAKREDAKRVAVRGTTLSEALVIYESYLKAKRRAAITVKDYRRLVEMYLKDWLDRPLIEITRADCRRRHTDIATEIARGKYAGDRKRGDGFGEITANKVLRAFRAIYNRTAVEHEELSARITASVQWNAENRRTSVIKAADFAGWYKTVAAQSNSVRRDFVLFALFSGLRRTNAAEVQWEHVNWQRRSIFIPKPKSGRPFELPLSDFLVQLLELRKEENKKIAPDSPWVFPAAVGDGHIVETRIEHATQYTTHDLRRTFITVAESLEISPYAIKLLVNHSLPKGDVTGGYIVPELERLRAPMQAITDRLLALAKGKSARIVPLRKRSTN